MNENIINRKQQHISYATASSASDEQVCYFDLMHLTIRNYLETKIVASTFFPTEVLNFFFNTNYSVKKMYIKFCHKVRHYSDHEFLYLIADKKQSLR